MLIRIMEFPRSCCPDSSRLKMFDRGVACALHAGAEVRSVYMPDAGLAICRDGLEVEFEMPLCGEDGRDGIESRHILLIATPESNGECAGLVDSTFSWLRSTSVSVHLRLHRLVGRSVLFVSRLIGSRSECVPW